MYSETQCDDTYKKLAELLDQHIYSDVMECVYNIFFPILCSKEKINKMRVTNLMCMWIPMAVAGYRFIGQESYQYEPTTTSEAELPIDPMETGLNENNQRLLTAVTGFAVTRKPTRKPTAKRRTVFNAFNGPLLTFQPGNFSKGAVSTDKRIKLSNGLSAKSIAQSGQFLTLGGGVKSLSPFHKDPDGAAVFSKRNGGWYYVSNAEDPKAGSNWDNGGVGAIEFNSNGNVVGYKRLVNSTKNNCGGGATPWNSWISCEEIDFGKNWQVDPRGNKVPTKTALGTLGNYESFAYDDSTPIPTFYVTRDFKNGVLTRFTPNSKGMECYKKTRDLDRWCTLEKGTLDFLLISGGESGTFQWTKNQTKAQQNAETYYPNAEGIDIVDGTLYFTSKVLKRLTVLDLKKMTYTYSSTRNGAFKEQPDQVERLVPNKESVLYFCEDVS